MKESVPSKKEDDKSQRNTGGDSQSEVQAGTDAPNNLALTSPTPPSIQRSVDTIQQSKGAESRRRVMSSLQHSYGNAYAARVARSVKSSRVQRHPAGFTPTVDPQTAVDEINNPSPGAAAETANATPSTPNNPDADTSTASSSQSTTPTSTASADQTGATPDTTQAPAQTGGSGSGATGSGPAPAPASPQAMSLATAQQVLQSAYGNVHQIVPGSIVLLANRAAVQAKYDEVTIALGATNPYVNPPRPWQAGDAATYIPTLEGFANAGTVYVNQQTPLVTATAHEMLHNNTGAGFRSTMGEAINEGSTEYFAISALNAAGVATPAGSTAYPDQVDLVTTLVGVVGVNALKQAYFNGGADLQALTGGIDVAQGVGTWQMLHDRAEAQDWAGAKALLRPGGGTQQEPHPITQNSEVLV